MENLEKSLDSLIDELFSEEESEVVEKSMIKDQAPQKETADEAAKMIPKAEKDEARDAGRPKQISSIPQVDTDGKRDGEYDGDIATKNEDAKKKEDSQVQVTAEMKKSISDAEWQEFQALKKAQAEKAQEEALAKARKEQTDLIKSAVMEATSEIRKENEELRKALTEQSELIKSMANKPQRSKAITNIAAVEKFQKSEAPANYSKAEVLDVAESLVKSGKLTMEHVIELEQTGFIYEPEARAALESAVKRR